MTRATRGSPTAEAWCDNWMDTLAANPASMTQRKLDSVRAKGGGLSVLKRSAKAHGVHLLQITDDRGVELIAASTHPFKILA